MILVTRDRKTKANRDFSEPGNFQAFDFYNGRQCDPAAAAAAAAAVRENIDCCNGD